jgi:archaemetzincin
MKLSFIILTLFLISFTNCRKQPLLSFENNNDKQLIAFIPIDSFNMFEIKSVLVELSVFYRKRVVILKPIDIPSNYYNKFLNQYFADSILDLLAKIKNDGIADVVGLTHQPIFMINKDHKIPYYEEKIFGFGDHPGNACIISDNRFKIEDTAIYHSRLKKVVIHEIGHNMGLPHCKDDKCIMSPKNSSLIKLDTSDIYYCLKCIKKLHH